MLRPISTLRISEMAMEHLRRNGYLYLEDILDNPESHKFLNENELKIIMHVPKTVTALQRLQKESQRDTITTQSQSINDILDGGFHCGTMTELCGTPGSGKTQICFQICTAVQLSKPYGGLNGKVVYIDTRNEFSPLRLQGYGYTFACNRYIKPMQNLIASFPRRPVSPGELTIQVLHRFDISLACRVSDCQQRWVRLREKFSKERRVQEEFERTGNKEFKLSSWPFYDDLRFLEPFIKRRKVYLKSRYPEQKATSTPITTNVNTTVFSNQKLTQLKPIQQAGVAQPVGFNQGNLSFVQVPDNVMVQLVGNQNHLITPAKTVESLSGESTLPSNVEVVYQNEATTSSESSSFASQNNENPKKRKKKRKRKCVGIAEDAISNLSSVMERYLDTYKKDENPDEIFGKLIATELANRPELEKTKLKRRIMKIIWDDSQ